MSVTAMPAPAGQGAAPPAAPAPAGKKKMLVVLALVVAMAGAAYWFVLKPAPAEGAKAKPEAGDVVALEPIQINLADGRYLRIGVALQLTKDVKHKADGSAALDATIDLFSGMPLEHISQPAHRKELKKELEKELKHLYHGEVMGVYFTDFVTQ